MNLSPRFPLSVSQCLSLPHLEELTHQKKTERMDEMADDFNMSVTHQSQDRV